MTRWFFFRTWTQSVLLLFLSIACVANAAEDLIGGNPNFTLSAQEAQFIGSLAPLKVMVDDDFVPLSRYDPSSNSYQGISVDLFRHLAQRLGLKYQLLHDKQLSWSAKVALFNQQQIDLLMPVSITPERAAAGNFSSPFYDTYYGVIAQKSRHIKLRDSYALAQYRVGVTKASAILSFIQPFVPAAQIVRYDTQTALYQAVRIGEVDVALQNQNVFAEDRFNLEFFDLTQIHTIQESPRRYAFYLNHTAASQQLTPILNRYLAGVDNSRSVARHERGEDELVLRYTEQKQQHQRLLLGIVSACALLLFLGLAYVNHRRLAARLAASLQQLQAQQIELRHSEEKFRAIADCTVNLEIWFGRNGQLHWVNPAVLAYTGYSVAECLALPDFITTLVYPPDMPKVAPEMKKGLQGLSGEELEFRCIRKTGTLFWLSVSWVPIFDTQGRFNGFRLSGRDITERQQLAQQVQQLAFHDPLTQLPNRRLLQDRLNQAMALSQRSACYGALLFLDLDNFKPLNDTYGHGVGDLLLTEVARRLNHGLRKTDTVARFGGDEFVILLQELATDPAAASTRAHAMAETIRLALSRPYQLTLPDAGQGAMVIVEHHCTASIGISLFRGHEASPDNCLKWADLAMYQAKEAGRNLIRFYTAPALQPLAQH